ncbi:hypothetical protein N783_13125 [Pontibacillus marinus BH030004 = DSM 16465]|uniref:DUF5316 domain-containing protein n=1 Tax=Pontibacillus marinus BH030004 = DSM 16465 TaxID=1385511 RepID=A0A0A5G470_9BACI|nr:hypothetical protein [Pontibacillus marinus]KGX85928.1 hypothetical protein N783_13125 [Pontibacillus marinus BH030004 = DSM 16465]
MKKTFLLGLLILLLSAIIAIFNVDLFLKVTLIISGGSIIISGLFLRVFKGGKNYDINIDPNQDRGDRRLGLKIASFGLPFIITAITLLLIFY